MKLPKFMKSHKSESQKSSGRQLLITELNFQPHKNAAAIMNFDKSLYMTPRGLNKAMMMTPKLGTDNKPVVVANNYGGRYVKSAQPKRLQNKPKVHAGSVAVQPKPINTPITQMLATTRTSLVFDTTPVLKKLENQQSQSALTGRKLESSSAVDTVDSKPAPMKSVESSSPANKENVAATPSKLDTALVETPHATNRFSFSKLTRFVSKSALKVMSRKLSSSPMSLDSSTASSSSASISPPSTPTRTIIESDLKRDGEKGQEVVDKDDVKRDEDINKPVLPLLPSIPSQSAQQQAVYCELDSASSNCGQVYKSDEQRAEIEKRVARMIEEQRACPATSIRSNWCSSSSRLAPIRNRVPNMGITSVMLRELKRKQQETNGVNSSGTIGIIPFACLISAPHIFPSTISITQQPPVVEHQKVTPHQEEEKEDENDSTLQQSPPQYDRLSRVPFLGDEVTSHSATKKTAMLSRPMVKSLSSIAPLVMPPPPTPSTPTQTATQTPSSCRISIFSARKLQLNSMCQSTGHLVASQQPFESFSETVF